MGPVSNIVYPTFPIMLLLNILLYYIFVIYVYIQCFLPKCIVCRISMRSNKCFESIFFHRFFKNILNPTLADMNVCWVIVTFSGALPPLMVYLVYLVQYCHTNGMMWLICMCVSVSVQNGNTNTWWLVIKNSTRYF